jgi:serine/threonine protein kinase
MIEANGRCYLVQEWRDGFLMSSRRHYSLAEVIWIGEWISSALNYLHHSCFPALIHRDLQPANILLSASIVSLLDFGLARWADEKAGKHAGTPGYVAPEQWHHGSVAPESDIFSFGMLLGCALTGCDPEEVIEAESFTRLWKKSDFPPPQEIVPLLRVLDRAIEHNVCKRATLADVYQELIAAKRFVG